MWPPRRYLMILDEPASSSDPHWPTIPPVQHGRAGHPRRQPPSLGHCWHSGPQNPSQAQLQCLAKVQTMVVCAANTPRVPLWSGTNCTQENRPRTFARHCTARARQLRLLQRRLRRKSIFGASQRTKSQGAGRPEKAGKGRNGQRRRRNAKEGGAIPTQKSASRADKNARWRQRHQKRVWRWRATTSYFPSATGDRGRSRRICLTMIGYLSAE